MSKISLVRKVTMIATTLALALAAFSATNVFAAGTTTTATPTQATTLNLEKSWKAESSAVQVKSEILNRFDRKLDDKVIRGGLIVRRDEQGKSDAQLGEILYSMWLGKAEAVVSAHAGFDASGMVTDQAMATKSVQDLAKDLATLRETNLNMVSTFIRSRSNS